MRFISVLIIASFPLLAEETGTGSSDFYLGGRVGLSQFQGACDDDALKCDSDKTGIGIYGGYQLFDWMALEGGFTSYGEAFGAYEPGFVSADVYGSEITAKFSYGLSPKLDIYARLGASYQNISKLSDWETEQESNSWNTVTAIGLDYSLSRHWSLRGDYQFIDGIGDGHVLQSDLHFTSIGLTYRFGGDDIESGPIVMPAPKAATETQQATKFSVTYQEPAPKKIVLTADSLFGNASSTIEMNQRVNYLVDELKQLDGKVTVIGHTDSRGSDIYNQALSIKRAHSMANHLISEGIDSNRIIVDGRGESEPIATNTTATGRALNRRVSIQYDAKLVNGAL